MNPSYSIRLVGVVVVVMSINSFTKGSSSTVATTATGSTKPQIQRENTAIETTTTGFIPLLDVTDTPTHDNKTQSDSEESGKEFDTREKQEQFTSKQYTFNDKHITDDHGMYSNITTSGENTVFSEFTSDTPVTEDVGNRAGTSVDPVQWVGYVTVPLLFSTGVLGNVLIICVMRRPAFQNKSFSVLTIVLACSDLVMSVMFPFNKQFVIRLLQWDIRSQGWFGCRLFFWLWRTSKMSASWLIVLLSIERFVAVWLPLHVKQLCTFKNGCRGSLLVFLVIGIFNGVWVSISDHLHNGVCSPNFPVSEDMVSIVKSLVIAGASVYCLIPGFLISVFNILIVGKLHKNKNIQMALGRRNNVKAGNKAWTMLVSISIAFIILVVPTGILHCYSVFSGQKIYVSNKPNFVIVREIAQFCEQLNHAINLFMYILCNKRFRTELKLIVTAGVLTKTNSLTANETRMTSLKEISNQF